MFNSSISTCLTYEIIINHAIWVFGFIRRLYITKHSTLIYINNPTKLMYTSTYIYTSTYVYTPLWVSCFPKFTLTSYQLLHEYITHTRIGSQIQPVAQNTSKLRNERTSRLMSLRWTLSSVLRTCGKESVSTTTQWTATLEAYLPIWGN